jgi:phosphate transport system protein
MSLLPHTSHEFEAELVEVRRRLLAMGKQVDEVVESSAQALLARNVALANAVILRDREADSMELEIDHLCLEILARRQPVAGDLRLLTSTLKLVVDLERVGDLGVSIAERVVELGHEPPIIPYDDLLVMMTTARGMVSDALTALVEEDVTGATHVIEKDDVVDAYYVRIFNDIVIQMREHPDSTSRATRLQTISKYVERIGDHATKIAERVVFILTGEEFRQLNRVPRSDMS